MISQKIANLKHVKVLTVAQNFLTLCREHPPMGDGKVVASIAFGQRCA